MDVSVDLDRDVKRKYFEMVSAFMTEGADLDE